MTTARDQRDPQRNERRAHLRREAIGAALTLFALIALLAIAITAAHFDAGRLSPVIAMTLSASKALIVAIIFMRLAREPGVVRLFAAAGLLWLAILFTLALADYQTRPARDSDRATTRVTDHAESRSAPSNQPAQVARTPPEHP
jgi:caa(3)-type oxidase subunit IV